MVEQSRRPRPVVTLQAGPGEADPDVSVRISNRSTRVLARQLAAIGDQLDREWTRRGRNWPPTPLLVLRPAQTLTRTIYRDIQNQTGGFQGLSAALKAWIVNSTPGQGFLNAEAWTSWVSTMKPMICTDWTRRSLLAVALAAALTFISAAWMEWQD